MNAVPMPLRYTFITAFFVAFIFTPAVAADNEQYRHYSGEPALTLDQALTNLRDYNRRLQLLLNNTELDASDMGEVHQLTYTLENALQRLEQEVETIQEQLEVVHKGSEALDTERVKRVGQKYLTEIAKITTPPPSTVVER